MSTNQSNCKDAHKICDANSPKLSLPSNSDMNFPNSSFATMAVYQLVSGGGRIST